MRTKPPCKVNGIDCPRRAIGCHSGCKDYQEWKAALAQEKAKQWLYRAADNEAQARTKDKLVKIGKRIHSKRMVGQP